VPDLRNTPGVDIIHELNDYGVNVLVLDVKGFFSPAAARKLVISYWRL